MTSKKFNKLELACLALGVLPIPIVGEIAGSIGMYAITKDMPLFEDKKGLAIGTAIATTALMRLSMYEKFPGFKSAYDYLLKQIS